MGPRSGSATLGGVSLKLLSLVTLTFQNSALILIMHYSRVMPLVDGQRYHTSTSVFLNEVIKLGISLTMALHEASRTLPSNTTIPTLFRTLTTAVFSNESWKLAIPAVLYTIQNSLQYVAVSNLDAATFQVTYQLKILTTAIFSVLMLGRSLSSRKWISLLLLVVGVAIIQMPQNTTQSAAVDDSKSAGSKAWGRTLETLHSLGSHAAARLAERSASYQGIDKDRTANTAEMNSQVGLAAVLVACALSGLAGVTFEKILKDSSSSKNTSLWVRNCQLSFWSLFPSLFIGVLWKDGEIIAKTGFFAGYNWVVWTAIMFQAAGGVIVALVINYADNIAKNFATSISILISCIASVYFFDFEVTRSFFLGTCVVLFATYLYTKPERSSLQSPMRIADFEQTTVDRNPWFKQFAARNTYKGAEISGINCVSPTLVQFFASLDHASTMIQPDVRQPARPIAPRDRYRASQYDNPMYDVVEDDDYYNQDEEFDVFDQRLLQLPYEDRQRHAARGTARLSLAPGPSRSVSHIAPSQLHSDYPAQCSGLYVGPSMPIEAYDRVFYNVTHPGEPSSDGQVGPSSSPALRASQRRADQITVSSSSHGLRLQSNRNAGQHALGYSREDFAHTDRIPNFSTPKPSEHDRRYHVVNQQQESARPSQRPTAPKAQPHTMDLPSALPTVQGIRLIPISVLPDRLRSVFSFPMFNAVQSKCFDKVFRTDENFVLASPTGSGKTAILELAICRAVATKASDQYKVIYQAPTKALCAERQRDWGTKFMQIGLKCVELTGDSNASDLRNVQSANIIITTPEKWDSITRKWKDHEKLMNLIKLFLIDEVHILKEDRGAVLEAVVSRMKSISTGVRFVALSATVPNLHDVASWLGKCTSEPHEPAASEKFSEEFRPVKLRKHVRGYVCNHSNDFAFEKFLDARLPDVIVKYSERKPMMVFCATRNSTVNTAKLIAKWWISQSSSGRVWNPPSKPVQMLNKDLRDTVTSGVAFHHAGLDLDDRVQVEKGFLDGEISVICCTSTLAVGVNLPCHLVIIKNTVAFTAEGLQEYSDLEMMQMLGRAGRPQFDDSAVAVIMTRQTKVSRYELMVTGQEMLESKLHLNLIDHMNAEIGLGTIRDLLSARNWLSGTFFYIRLQKNHDYYKLEEDSRDQDIQELVNDICSRDVTLLKENNLVHGQDILQCTEFGHAMARYYIHFKTMKVFMGLKLRSSPSEILSAISQASEFSMIRFRQGEKSFYKSLNKSPSIRWPIPVNLDLPAQKVSLIIQSILGSADIMWSGEMGKHKSQYTMETQLIFRNVSSLIRCIIDCQVCLGDSLSIHSALLLERSLGARAWDDSPLQMKQIEGIGVVAVRKLVNAGIRSMDDLETCEAHRIEAIIGRNPPFGLKILENVKLFPKLHISLHARVSSILKVLDGVKIQIKADMGFINNETPQRFENKLVYVCLLAETSDGRKIHFARISASKLGLGQSLVFPAQLTSQDQSINCYVMCDGIAGTMQSATVKPQISPSLFSARKSPEQDNTNQSNMSKRRIESIQSRGRLSSASDDFGDDGIADDELMKVPFDDVEFDDIENYVDPTASMSQKFSSKNTSNAKRRKTRDKSNTDLSDVAVDENPEPGQLANGKWACNHLCKDRKACKHFCCKNGMDKPPKKKALKKRASTGGYQIQPTPVTISQKRKGTQTRLKLTASKHMTPTTIEELDLTQQEKKRKTEYAKTGPKDYRGLHQLHKTIQGEEVPLSLHSVMHKKPDYCYSQGGGHNLSFMADDVIRRPQLSNHYGAISFTHQDLLNLSNSPKSYGFMQHSAAALISQESDVFDDDESLLRDALVGLEDSQNLRIVVKDNEDVLMGQGDSYFDGKSSSQEKTFLANIDCKNNETIHENVIADTTKHLTTELPLSLDRSPFFTGTNSHETARNDNQPRESITTAVIMNPGKFHPQLPEPILKSSNNATDKDTVIAPNALDTFDAKTVNKVVIETKPVSEAFKDLEPWLFQEFGDIVELIDE
ncbi:nucleotide-sugar transporter-domain-containing protein [Pyrenochaeta sp. MPI-SDFR-AT-0127]|nr:nucleotide-sugar transporter-domain-containing protein [Pyrenochaeta sp. MPI-SDFR-AT-0127]